jgi:ABC-2 type transport system ATP-binding protein
MNDLLRIFGIKKKFGTNYILKGISLKLKANQIVGLIGPNGAGKTTLLKIIATLMQPTSGKIRLCGYDSNTNLSIVRSMIGYCPDNLPIVGDITGYQFLKFFSDFYYIDEKKFNRAIAITGLGRNDLNRKLTTYSNGMKKRILIGRVLLLNSNLILLDEPTSGLDPEGQRFLQNLLLSSNKKDKLILLSSHNLYEIERICDKILILEDGYIKQISSINEMFKESDDMIVEILMKDIDDEMVLKMIEQFKELTFISSELNKVRFFSKKNLNKVKLQKFLKKDKGELIEIKYY